MKHRFCDLNCFECKYSDCLCPDAECVNGLRIDVGLPDEPTELNDEEREARRIYQREWRANHPEKVKYYNSKHYKKER